MSKEVKQETKQNDAKKGLQTKHVVLILGILIIVAGAVFAIVFFMPKEEKEVRVPVVDENNLAMIEEEIEEKVAKGQFETYMNVYWSFENGKSASRDALMGNSVNNLYPFWFTVSLKDTDEIVYESSLLPVGSKVNEIKLSKNLSQGSYPARVTIYMVDEEGNEIDGNMSINIELIIEN